MSDLRPGYKRRSSPNDRRGYATLKKSLSASSSLKGRSRSPNKTRSISPNPSLQPVVTDKAESPQNDTQASSTRPLSVDIPKTPCAANAALSALRYLPTPLLVLSSMKTVILANEAMARLLGIDNLNSEDIGANNDLDGVRTKETGGADLLYGQTLSQIGIDMMQDGQQIWVTWEKFLDSLADEFESTGTDENPPGKESKPDSRDKTTTNSGSQMELEVSQLPEPGKNNATRAVKSEDRVHDAVVDVILYSQYLDSGSVSSAKSAKSSASDSHVAAKMIISIWTLENQRYYTLTFTSATGHALPGKRSTHSRTVSRTPTMSPSSRSFPSSPNNPQFCATCGSVQSPVASPTTQPVTVAPFPPMGAPGRTDVAVAPAIMHKLSRLKDAIINAMGIPVLAMWKDESVSVPNKACLKLMHKRADPTSDDTYDMLSRYKVYTSDFQQELTPDEFPIVQLCRTQKPFKAWQVGIMKDEDQRKVYDIDGEGIYDQDTGEFLAGIISLTDVTEYTNIIRNQHEDNERQFELICETMPQMLWNTTPNGDHDWFSKRWYDYTGLTQQQSLGPGWQHPFHEEDVPQAKKRWIHSLESGDEYVTEYRCKRHDGVWRWMLGRAQPLRDPNSGEILKWFGSCTDIHEMNEARRTAKETREQMLNVIKHAHVTVWVVNKDRRLTFLQGKLMWDPEETDIDDNSVGQNVYEVFGRHLGARDLPMYKTPIENILDGNGSEGFAEHHIDGNKRWFRTRFVPMSEKKSGSAVNDGDRVHSVIGISVDVTEMKDREKALKSQEKENIRLVTAETAAKEASRLKSQFLANMSHEIRTPIAGVIGMAELLTDTNLDEDQRECAENIQRSANGLLTVINDILDLSKVESGKLDIEEVQFNLSVVIQDVCKMLSFAAERRNVSFMSDIQVGVDQEIIVMGDPGRVRQIVTNLLTNSIKFTQMGHVKLAMQRKEETDETISILFTVEDTGIGIEEEVLTKLFKPFSQADSSTARRFGGTGLGLTICKNLVDLMHGHITLESELGRGTKAIFWIPFNKPQFTSGGSSSLEIDFASIPDRLQSEMSVSGCASEHRSGTGTPPQSPHVNPAGIAAIQRKRASGTHITPSPTSGSGEHDVSLQEIDRANTHVLVVEDNQINQQIALRTIKKFGFSVNAVWNGQEALDYLMQEPSPTHPKPDIVLMDVQMPTLDGYRATHMLRHHAPYASVASIRTLPIVAMTASAIQGDKEKCQRAGMDDYLAKPVRGKTLENMLLKWAHEGKNKARLTNLNESLNTQHTDHDSNCTDPESTKEAINPNEPTPTPALKNEIVAEPDTYALPSGAENEGDRGMQRVEAEEKATSLRDDKLLAAGEAPPYQHHLHPSSNTPPPKTSAIARPSMPPSALTEENITRLDREHEHGNEQRAVQERDDADSLAMVGGSREEEEGSDSGGGSGGDGGGGGERASTVGDLHGPISSWKAGGNAMGMVMRGRLARHESDNVTVTQDSVNLGRGSSGGGG